jgi:hypothetical protein
LFGHQSASQRGEAMLQNKFVTLGELQEILARTEPVGDEVIIDMFGRFLPSYSLLWSAGYLLGAAGLVCYHRPHLAERILVRPIECLFVLGARRAEHVLCWVNPRLQDRLDVAEAGSESILAAPRTAIEGFRWFRPWPFNGNVCLDTLFRDLVKASGADAEGFEWLKANLPLRRDFIQGILDLLLRKQEGWSAE